MTRLVDPAAATREHLFQRFTFSATDGSHAIDVLYYQPRAASADLPFPFRTTHLDLTADAAPRTTPIDLPAGWENP
ncbi:MAG TPA: hypothetical protein VME40_09590, partial [Caulobacteraceae bacterium]|nr:hypothetical protein [Caulobacteraceae bacterium]